MVTPLGIYNILRICMLMFMLITTGKWSLEVWQTSFNDSLKLNIQAEICSIKEILRYKTNKN